MLKSQDRRQQKAGTLLRNSGCRQKFDHHTSTELMQTMRRKLSSHCWIKSPIPRLKIVMATSPLSLAAATECNETALRLVQKESQS